jgi:Ciliary BBSome complex subunit 1
MKGQQSKVPKEASLWIDAYKSVTNQLDTYSNNIELVDIDENGENKLVVADFPGMITVYKGVNVDWQTQLPDSISAVGQFQASLNKNSSLD